MCGRKRQIEFIRLFLSSSITNSSVHTLKQVPFFLDVHQSACSIVSYSETKSRLAIIKGDITEINNKELVSFVLFFSKVRNSYNEISATNMNSSSRVTPLTKSKPSTGLQSSSRSRLMKIHGKNQGHRPLSSPVMLDIDEPKSKAK